MNVSFLPKVYDYLESLIPILHNNGYFSYEHDAIEYVDGLIDEIQTKLPTSLHKPAPPYFNKYGKNMKYVVFKKNKRTSWYAFFKTYNKNGEKIFLIRYIANNHTVAQHL